MNITIYFPVKDTTVITVLEKGVLFGVQGAQGIQGVQGIQGAQGAQGIPGIGIPSGGAIGQVLVKTSTTDYITGWLTLDKTAIGLSNVDNTSDLSKPISNATQTALNLKQDTITLTTTHSSGAATLVSNVLNIPNYDLTGLGGQPLNANLTSVAALTYASTSFVKMTAAGTFALDTATYLTAESDTLASVTGRGNTTTNAITVGGLVVNSQSAASVPVRINLAASQSGNALEIANSSGTVIGRFTNGGQLSTNTFFNLNGNGSIQLGTDLIIGTGNTSGIQMFQTTRNVVIQNGGTFTDAGYRLDVNGTARIQNQLTTTGSITAASAIARGVYMNQTLVAAANSDVLVGLDINPTFTVGSFTGTTSAALRVGGNILPSVTATYDIGNSAVRFRNAFFTGDVVSSNNVLTANMWTNVLKPNQGGTTILFTDTSANAKGQFYMSTGNLLLQNGGTFTDNGFRLEVVGTAKITNALTLGNLSSDPTGSNGMIYYNTTSNTFKVYQNGAWRTITAI